eukprot:894534-Pelagomonas_calceolata.AAC.1
MLLGIWRVAGSTRLQNLAVRSITVFNTTSCGNKLVGILNRMGMKFVSKFNGTSMVQSKLLKLVASVLNITSPTNTQENNMKSHSFCTDKIAEVCIQLLSRPPVFTLVRLSHAVGAAGPQCGFASAA